MNYLVWTTKDGRQIELSSMTDLHLLHTIRALDEGRLPGQESDNWLIVLKADALKRGLTWDTPPSRKVKVFDLFLERLKNFPMLQEYLNLSELKDYLEIFLKGAGIPHPEVDVSNLDGTVTYLHWAAGGTPLE